MWWSLKLELDPDTPADVTIKVDDLQGEEKCVNPDFDAQTLWSYPVETLDSLGNRNVVVDISEGCEAVGRITSKQQVTHFGKICTAIASSNTITSSVRDFSLVLDGRVFEASGNAGAAALKILADTIAALKNLETVTIHIKEGSYFLPIIPITRTLLGMPFIQTVILIGVNCSLIAAGSRPALKNVKNIYLRSCENVQVLLPLMPSLEVLSYTNDMANDSLVITDPLPWETLRELTIESSVDVFTIRNIANNFVVSLDYRHYSSY